MKNSLNAKGLSLSQAQSISNLCNQRCLDINSTLSNINNVSKTLMIDSVEYTETVGKKLPGNVVDLLIEKAKLHATQAFLMENIKAKDLLLKYLQLKPYTSIIGWPEEVSYETAPIIPLVNEDWGWNQLSTDQYNEYLDEEAHASHIGQFIHKDSVLDKLRKDLPGIKTLEWITIKEGVKTPLKVTIHHSQEELLTIHEKLAAMHRLHEQRVNYYKALVKNMVTEENARIANENASVQAETTQRNNTLRERYSKEYGIYEECVAHEKQNFEAERQKAIKETAALRIDVDSRFQPVVNFYLNQLR